ncbi:MAG: hypothetical protein N3B13_09690, partial [Deltaproteobacteria bacterium]|nr:hypothetical protein [Deltaproteobacteria bacterium]
MNKAVGLIISVVFLLSGYGIYAEEFLTPSGQPKQVSVQNDRAKYFEIKPGQELTFKVTGPNSIKIYGRVLNPLKSGNASFMVYQGSTLIGAMLVTPKTSQDFANGNKNLVLSAVSVQEFNISDGEQTIKIKSSAKSPDSIVAVEVMKSPEASIDLVPLVPLAPLVPQKTEEKPASVDLVPLVPLTPPPETKTARKEEKPLQTTPEKPKKEETYKEIVAQKTPETVKKETAPSVTTVVETTEKPFIGKRIARIGADIGMIIPFQSIGGPYINAAFTSLFFPVKTNYSFGIGLKAGYHNLRVDIKDGTGKKIYEMSSSLVPVNLILMYSIPISKLIVTD